jgi:hypothetical protein
LRRGQIVIDRALGQPLPDTLGANRVLLSLFGMTTANSSPPYRAQTSKTAHRRTNHRNELEHRVATDACGRR